MDIIVRARRNGKTTEMINQMKHWPMMVAVCIHEEEVNRLEQEYPEMKGRFVSYQKVLDGGLFGRKPDPMLFLDNADMILSGLFRHEIYAATFTED